MAEVRNLGVAARLRGRVLLWLLLLICDQVGVGNSRHLVLLLLGVVTLSIRLPGVCVEHMAWLLLSLPLLLVLVVRLGKSESRRLRRGGGRREGGGWVADWRGWMPLRPGLRPGLADGDEARSRHGGDWSG